MSGMLTVFFFARLWRRANVMTDIEFAEIRYAGKPASFLRGFRAIYLGDFVNLIILGWVTRAMIKILTISLGVNPYVAVGICFVITVAYSVAAGMWAVLWTDLVQFVIKMTAVIVLAVYAVRAVGGMDALKTKVSAHFGSEAAALSVLPVASGPDGLMGYAWMPLLSARRSSCSCSGGRRGIPALNRAAADTWRSASSRRRRSATACLRRCPSRSRTTRCGPWPWIITGLATIVLYPNGIGPDGDREGAYVQAYVDLLPTPWKGFMMAGFAAAYMSTVGDPAQLGRVVSGERLLQAVPAEGRDRRSTMSRFRAGRRSCSSCCRSSSRRS